MSDTAKKRKYKKPAVQEAIFEAKFEYDNFDLAIPGQIFEKIKESYPKKKNIELFTVILGNTNTPQPSSQPPQTPRIQFWKEDDSELVQIGPGIATINRLKYSNWENFTPVILTIIDDYISTAQPQNVTRLGIRYINNFLIPEGNINLNEYFNLGIQAPATFNNLQGFDLTIINKFQNDVKTPVFEVRTKFATIALKSGEIGNRFILDIDCYTEQKITPEIEDVVSLATRAHDIVALVFESIITDKIRTLMEVE